MEYTNKDFLDAYCKKRGLTMKDEADDSIHVLMPFVMMDVAYEYYTKNILRYKAKQWAKKCKSNWADSYKEFNDFLFQSFDPDMQNAFMDKMDKFKKFMYVDIIALQAKMLRCLPTKSSQEKRQIIAAAMLFNRIAREAQDWWCTFYTKTVHIRTSEGFLNHQIHTQNGGLNGCLTWSKEFAAEIMKGDPTFEEPISVADEAALWKAVDDFKEKVMKFPTFDQKS